jgi:hypothetical protein
MYETDTRFQKLGIKMITVEKRYLSFALDNGENHIIDTKEQSIWDAFLYKDGRIPITVDIVINNWTDIAAYLDLSESEVVWLTGGNEESGDPGYTFDIEDKTLDDKYSDDNCVIALKNHICKGVMTKEIAGSTGDITFSVEYPQITSATINGTNPDVTASGVNKFLYSLALMFEGKQSEHYGHVGNIRQTFFDGYIEYKTEYGEEMPWTYEHTVEVRSVIKRGGSDIIFFKDAIWAYSGGAHGGFNIGYFGYDLTAQRQVTLNDVITDKSRLDAIAEKYFKEQFDLTDEPYAEQGYFFDDFAVNDNFYLNDEGIFFYFNQYEITCYACHKDIHLFIPWSAIEAITKK